ncbi:MAG: SAM-dependent methyltransferase, partial [Betaproteobacteria bacterium]
IEGRSVALVTDAGTPGISDPGAVLVREVRVAGCRVVPVPGPSAIIAALSAAGIESAGFSFEGFLPARKEARRQVLAHWLARESPTLVHEAPHRIRESVEDMLEVLGPERRLTFARELTKVFESMHDCALGEAPGWLDADPNRARGEFVLILHGVAKPLEDARDREGSRVLDLLMRELPASQAAKLAARITGARKSDLYEQALRLKAASDPHET